MAIALLAELTPSACAKDGPKPMIDHWVVEFGTVEQHTLTTRTLQIRNEGDEPLQFKGIEIGTAYSLFIYSLPDEEVPPGGTAALTIYLDSSNRVGDIGECVDIYCNTVPISYLHVCAKATIEAGLSVLPRTLYFWASDPDDDRKSVAVRNAVRIGFDKATLVSPPPGIDMRVEKLTNHLVLTFSVDRERFPKQNLNTPFDLAIQLERPGHPTVTKRVSVLVTGL